MKKILTILLSNGETVTTEIEAEENVSILDFSIDEYYEEEVSEEELEDIVEEYKEIFDLFYFLQVFLQNVLRTFCKFFDFCTVSFWNSLYQF